MNTKTERKNKQFAIVTVVAAVPKVLWHWICT